MSTLESTEAVVPESGSGHRRRLHISCRGRNRVQCCSSDLHHGNDYEKVAHRAWLGAATRESELETRVCLPVIVVNRHGLYVIMAVFGGAILGGACVLGYFDMLNRMLKRAFSSSSSDDHVGGNRSCGTRRGSGRRQRLHACCSGRSRVQCCSSDLHHGNDYGKVAHRAWLGAATRESELETRVSIPVVFVNRHGLYVIMAVFGEAILGGACVLGCFDMLNRILKRYAVPSPPGSTPQTRSLMATLVPTT
ncbi:hypothetical protein MRX96_016975 [Rhipicephalus microplus]